MEFEIVRKLGANTYSIFRYLKANPTSRNMDIEVDLGISGKSVSRMVTKLKHANVLRRTRGTANVYTVVILPETEWSLS